MAPYFVYFGLILSSFLINSVIEKKNIINQFLYFFIFIISIIFVGLRYDVGGDWVTYLRNLDMTRDYTFLETIKFDPTNLKEFSVEVGFSLITWISLSLNLGIVGVNIISAILFFIGLFALCRKSDNFWLSILILIHRNLALFLFFPFFSPYQQITTHLLGDKRSYSKTLPSF